MTNLILTFIFLGSLSVAIVNIFHPQDYLLEKFSSTEETSTENKEVINPFEVEVQEEGSLSVHMERGDSYLRQAFVELAKDEYFLATKLDPSDSRAYFKLAETQTLLQNYQGAIINLQSAKKLDASNTAIDVALAKNHIHLQQFDEALATVNSIIPPTPESTYYQFALSIIRVESINPRSKVPEAGSFEKSTRIQKAFDTYNLLQDGEKIYLKALIAQALSDNEDYELALVMTQKILEERSDYRDTWIVQGYSALNLENYELARNSFQTAYDLDPTKSDTQFFLGVALEELKQRNEALEFYQLAYANGYEPRVHVIQKIAELSFDLGFYKEAYRLYDEMLKIKHESVSDFVRPVWIALGMLQDTQKGKDIAEFAQQSYPQEAESYNLLAWVSIEEQDYSTAQNYLNQAFEIDPNFASAHYNQGRIYERLGKGSQAIKHYELAYQADKDGAVGIAAAEAYNRLLNQ